MFAGKDVERLHPKHRPICAYEQQEYDLLDKLDTESNPKPRRPNSMDDVYGPNPHKAHIASLRENLHMLQIMITRANVALKINPTTETTTVTSDNYNMSSTKPSAALQALQILTREYRCTLNMLHRIVDRYKLPPKLIPSQ